MPPSIITLTTDFGRDDTYIAQMKGVILSINPAATIVDVTHEIPPQDILRGSQALGEMWQAFPMATIHGRDIIAPVAAHLSHGVRLGSLGPPATEVILLDCQEPRFEERQLNGTIISIDHFGNLITNIEVAHLRRIPTTEITVRCNQQQISGLSQTYGTHPSGALIALLSSQGHLELAIVNGNAADRLGAHVSDAVAVAW